MQINCCEDAAERVAGRDRRAGRAPVRGTGLRLRQHGFTAHSFVLACQSQQLDLPLRFRHQSILTGQRGFWRRGYRNDEHFLNHHMLSTLYSSFVAKNHFPYSNNPFFSIYSFSVSVDGWWSLHASLSSSTNYLPLLAVWRVHSRCR